MVRVKYSSLSVHNSKSTSEIIKVCFIVNYLQFNDTIWYENTISLFLRFHAALERWTTSYSQRPVCDVGTKQKDKRDGGMGVSLTPKQHPQSSGDGQDECGSDTDNHSCLGPASALPIHPPKHADKAKKKKETKNKNKNKKKTILIIIEKRSVKPTWK